MKITTTVKIEEGLYDEFKIFGIRHKLTLQNFFERVMFNYVHNDVFRDCINNFFLPASIIDGECSIKSVINKPTPRPKKVIELTPPPPVEQPAVIPSEIITETPPVSPEIIIETPVVEVVASPDIATGTPPELLPEIPTPIPA